jgi:RNA polymerase sigma factor (sigma-70 family)
MEVSALKQHALPGLRGPSPLLRLQSDERLIALVRRGQHAAFETLVSRYQSRLLAFCRHMLGSKEDAEDVLQEVFAAAFNAILADEREIHVRPWLYRIARNRSLNHLRKATAVGVDSMDVHFADGGLSTGEKVLRRESFRQLISDVQSLPETQRTALLLREIDALSYEQIAEAMETTIPSVKSLLVRARISLAEAAEARKLSCGEVRAQLGETAEGLAKLEPPARRHLRSCERCRAFKKQLKANNVALAVALPVGVIVTFRRLVTSKLGAGAGARHVAGAGGAGAGASAAASGGGVTASGFATAGAGAIATKAVAGLAAAALVTAGAVEAEHAASPAPKHHAAPAAIHAASAPRMAASPPTVVAATPQRTSALRPAQETARNASSVLVAHRKSKLDAVAKKASAPEAAGEEKSLGVPASEPVLPGDERPRAPVVTEVVSETTELMPPNSSSSTQAAQPPLPVESGTTTAPTSTSSTTSTTSTTTTTSESSTSSAEEPPATSTSTEASSTESTTSTETVTTSTIPPIETRTRGTSATTSTSANEAEPAPTP